MFEIGDTVSMLGSKPIYRNAFVIGHGTKFSARGPMMSVIALSNGINPTEKMAKKYMVSARNLLTERTLKL